MNLLDIPNHFLRQLSIIATQRTTADVTRIKCSIKGGKTTLTVVNGNLLGQATIFDTLGLRHDLECYFTIYGKPPSTGTANISEETCSCMYVNTNVKLKIVHALYHDRRTKRLKIYEKTIDTFLENWFDSVTGINLLNFNNHKSHNLKFLGQIFGNENVGLSRRWANGKAVMTVHAEYPDGEFVFVEIKKEDEPESLLVL